MAMSDDDRAALERAGHALMSPTATASEKKQLAQKLFEEHPQLLQVFLAGRGLLESLEPDALAFFGTLVSKTRLSLEMALRAVPFCHVHGTAPRHGGDQHGTA